MIGSLSLIFFPFFFFFYFFLIFIFWGFFFSCWLYLSKALAKIGVISLLSSFGKAFLWSEHAIFAPHQSCG